MRAINYYDRIHKEYIELEVTDEVARFLFANDKWLLRKQKQYEFYTISLDSPVYSNGDDDELTLADTLEEKQEETDFEICERQQKLAQIVRKVIRKLEPHQQKLVEDIYFIEKSQKQIAKELGVKESSISSAKDTVVQHLIYLFCTDNEFKQTYIYQRNKMEFEDLAIKNLKEINAEEQPTFNLNNIRELTKDNTQLMKSFSSLGIELDDNAKSLLSFMNRTVKNFLDNLNVDWNGQNNFTIPPDFDLMQQTNASEATCNLKRVIDKIKAKNKTNDEIFDIENHKN